MTAQTFSDALGEISDKYIMEAITYEGKPTRRANHPIRYRIIRAAACLLLAALLSGCTILAFVPEARAAFTRWVTEWYESHVVYRFAGGSIPEDLPRYGITELPEGFVETSRVQEGTLILCTYSGPDGGILYFDYMLMSDDIIEAVATNGIVPEPVIINGLAGDFYLSATASETNELIWFDQKADTSFALSSYFDKTVMLRIAQSVSLESSTN